MSYNIKGWNSEYTLQFIDNFGREAVLISPVRNP